MPHLLHGLCGCQGLTILLPVPDESAKEPRACDKAEQDLGFPGLLTFQEMSCTTRVVHRLFPGRGNPVRLCLGACGDETSK